MSDASSAEFLARTRRVVVEHRALYIRSGGREGHIGDSRGGGGHGFTTRCLIRYRGRKSGKVFVTPLVYADIGGEVVICGSKGGSDEHPSWYLNIVAGPPEIDFQIATQAFNATWREPEGEEREKVWRFMVDCFPPYGTYQGATDRQLPLVMMRAVAPIPVFTDPDGVVQTEG